jgi:hypothetical protein
MIAPSGSGARAPMALWPATTMHAKVPQCALGCIAQLVEQLTLNQRVAGSNPATPTNNIKSFRVMHGTACAGWQPIGNRRKRRTVDAAAILLVFTD